MTLMHLDEYEGGFYSLETEISRFFIHLAGYRPGHDPTCGLSPHHDTASTGPGLSVGQPALPHGS